MRGADVYALGCVLYNALTGECPTHAEPCRPPCWPISTTTHRGPPPLNGHTALTVARGGRAEVLGSMSLTCGFTGAQARIGLKPSRAPFHDLGGSDVPAGSAAALVEGDVLLERVSNAADTRGPGRDYSHPGPERRSDEQDHHNDDGDHECDDGDRTGVHGGPPLVANDRMGSGSAHAAQHLPRRSLRVPRWAR